MTKEERIRMWIDSLDPQKVKEIAIECVLELILVDTLCFYDDTKVPYWDATGETLDGSSNNED